MFGEEGEQTGFWPDAYLRTTLEFDHRGSQWGNKEPAQAHVLYAFFTCF